MKKKLLIKKGEKMKKKLLISIITMLFLLPFVVKAEDEWSNIEFIKNCTVSNNNTVATCEIAMKNNSETENKYIKGIYITYDDETYDNVEFTPMFIDLSGGRVEMG